MARLAGCVIYDVFKVTSRLRKVFQGTAGPFLFSAFKHMHVMGSSEWQQDQQADFHVVFFWCLYQNLSNLYRWGFLIEPFSQRISALIIWNSLTSAQIFWGNLLRLWRVLEQKDLWSAFHYSGAVGFPALSTCSPPSSIIGLFWWTFTRKLKGEKIPLSQI